MSQQGKKVNTFNIQLMHTTLKKDRIFRTF